MIGNDESPADMVERVSKTLFKIEEKFGTSKNEIQNLTEDFEKLILQRQLALSTPIITNTGRHLNKPLSACTVIPLDLQTNLNSLRKSIAQAHMDGMGTGFNLDKVEEPIQMLRVLNDIANEITDAGKEERPVGNIAIMSVHNPKIKEFISIKEGSDNRNEVWKFNLSVNITKEFMEKLRQNEKYRLLDEQMISADEIFNKIAEKAHVSGDPGILFMHRFEGDNQTPSLGKYESVAPCGEVGLMVGEACQFGSINLGRFVKKDAKGKSIDYEAMNRAVRLLTRALDNSLEISLSLYSEANTRSVMSARRKIGVGICGLADLLGQLHLSYDSEEARSKAVEVISFINYVSKLESHELAKKRGSFNVLPLSRYLESPGFIESKYEKNGTELVTGEMWKDLADKIRDSRLLRNVSTMALPPTGRSATIVDASQGIEPFFTLIDSSGTVNRYLYEELMEVGKSDLGIIQEIRKAGSIRNVDGIPEAIKISYKTGLEIEPYNQIRMCFEVQNVVDEAISKTINLPKNSTVKEIQQIYLNGYEMGLKGITVFREGSRIQQPKKLALV
ncbi:MAG: hypothetical protein KGH61_02955 [Candidatus Micrarchaeota archaeon]|nr:hypothetical protein [Candidatus Micrarchaeota archaeon]MDE1847882.1 hypothetical protein [Candidatus Micrarchaeota archaeon]MDE1864508.1 hypothetical protein [Candidatus Micrarchaeota archaeon]